MNRRIPWVLCALVLLCAGLTAASQADLTGTWLGSTQVPNVGEDKITLVLKRDAGAYGGIVSDTAGMVAEQAIRNVTFEAGVLTFDISVDDGSATFPVHIAVKIDGDKMTGAWSTEEGESAEITLARKAG
jgi:hypothetical protein